MIKPFLPLCISLTAIAAQAAIFNLDFGPVVNGFGLNGSNERPNPTGSLATGVELISIDLSTFGMVYNDDTKILQLNFGWGHEFFGTDLGSDFLFDNGAHIHGPADVNSTGPALYDLEAEAVRAHALNPNEGADFGSNDTGRSGAFDVSIPLVAGRGGYTVTEQEQQLLSGQWYIDIHSVNFPSGEIRGQLVPVPEPQTYGMLFGLGTLAAAAGRNIWRRRGARAGGQAA